MSIVPLRLRLFVCLAILTFAHQALSIQLPSSPPAAVGMSAERLGQMDQAIAAAIAKKELPGAVVLVARHGRVAWRKAYGSRALEPQREVMTLDTVFDLASLTKIVATATSVMILVEQGKVRLADPVVQFIPEMKGGDRDKITIEQLLTHTAGFAPDFDLRERWTGYDEALKRLYREPLRNQPGARLFIATSTTSHWVRWSIGSAAKLSTSLPAQTFSLRWECAIQVLIRQSRRDQESHRRKSVVGR
jgi:CubicO group peptidase (beta-lactamase class C family)